MADPKEFAPAVAPEPTLAERILFPAAVKFRFPVILKWPVPTVAAIPPAASDAVSWIAFATASAEEMITEPPVDANVRSAAPVTVKLDAVTASKLIPAPVSTLIAPANEFPIVTVPVEVPVLMLVLEFTLSLIRVTPSIFIPPEPATIVVVEVVLDEPKVNVLAAAPVPINRVVAAASAEMLIAPVPDTIANAPPLELMDIPPDPDWRVVIDAPVVLPSTKVFTAAPVARLTVVAEASAEMLIAFTPVATVKVPPPKEALPPVAVVLVPTVRDVFD